MRELILGLDPGSRHTGYGVVVVDGDDLEHMGHGVIHLKEQWSLAERLRVLHAELQLVFSRFPARGVAIEKIFFGKNADSAFKLGHARGVCMLVAAQQGGLVEEYAARYVKKCITGSGAADKKHVQLAILNILKMQPKELAFDASDALSLAVTRARVFEINIRVQKMLEGTP